MSIDRGDRQPSVLVTARSESAATTYLLYDGKRAQVDLRNPGVVWALRLDGIEPRPVSRSLLDAIPEAPPIAAPHIPDAGQPGAVAGTRVGTVVRVPRVDSDDFFVVLADGVQRIGEVAANLIRSLDSHGSQEMPSVSPDSVSGLPTVDSLPVSTYPPRAGATMGAGDGGVLCAEWLPAGPKTVLWMGDSLPTARESNRAGAGRRRGSRDRQRRHAIKPKRLCPGSVTGPRQWRRPSVSGDGQRSAIRNSRRGHCEAPRDTGRVGCGSMAGALPIASRTRTEQGQCASRA